MTLGFYFFFAVLTGLAATKTVRKAPEVRSLIGKVLIILIMAFCWPVVFFSLLEEKMEEWA